MHILVWHEAYVPGGGDCSLADLLACWPDTADRFTVALNDSHPSPGVISDTLHPIIRYRSWRDLTRDYQAGCNKLWLTRIRVLRLIFSQVHSLIKTIEPDGIILNNGGFPGGSSHYVALLCSAAAGIQIRMMIVRNFPSSVASKHKIRLVGLLVSIFATCVVAVSRQLADSLRSSAKLYGNRLVVVPNGVREPCISSQQEVKDGPLKVISLIGTIEKRKGHDVLLRAIAHVSDSQPQLEIVFTGYPVYPDLDEFKALAQSLGLQDRVRWRRFNQNIEEIFDEACLVVVPSVSHESFGRVAVEAMARGILVIVSDCGGLSEVVQHEVSGLVFPSGDHYALARAIERLIQDRQLRARLRSGGRLAFTKTYNANRMAHDYQRLLHDVSGCE